MHCTGSQLTSSRIVQPQTLTENPKQPVPSSGQDSCGLFRVDFGTVGINPKFLTPSLPSRIDTHQNPPPPPLCRFSDKYPFRMRSETSEIAIELSLQPWKAFAVDGVIMFSDILTILPALGVEFEMVKGKGPLIASPLRSLEDVRKLRCSYSIRFGS